MLAIRVVLAHAFQQVSVSQFIAQGSRLGYRAIVPSGNFYGDEPTLVPQVSRELRRLKFPSARRYGSHSTGVNMAKQ